MRTYTRARITGATYFFTVNVAERYREPLLVKHVDLLRAAFREVKRAHPFAIDAIVILPDHLHCLWTLPAGDDDFSKRWGLIKANFSRMLPRDEQVSASRLRKGERGIWQRRYWEHVIRDENDRHRHLDYIHYNPVKHGYVNKAGDWPYSSFRQYVDLDLYPENWVASNEMQTFEVGES